MKISTPIKLLIKEHFFMSIEDVESLCATASYIVPIQEYLDAVANNLTAFELNACMAFVRDNFANYTKASHKLTDRDEFVLLLERTEPIYQAVQLHCMRSKVKSYTLVPHEASGTGMARLEKTLG